MNRYQTINNDNSWGERIGGAGYLGLIDELKIFPYALTEDQIKTEYNLGAAAVMGTGPTVTPPAGGTLSDSIVAHWAFDEQYGQTAHDKVGNNHGTFGATTSPGSDDPTWKPGNECKVNGCASFDGLNDFSDTNLVAPGTGKATLTAWAKTGNLTTTRKAIIGGSIGGRHDIYIDGNIPKCRTWDTSEILISASEPVTSGEWIYLACSFNYDSGGVEFFVNGKLVGSSSRKPISAEGKIWIGDSGSGSTNPFNGLIDEVKIYDTALTADLVLQDMNAGASVAYSVGSEEADELADGAGAPPIAEWKFDEKQGTVAYDSSGNANDGTVNGATWRSGCQQGACLVFDGVNDYVSAGSNPITGTSAFTLEGWLKPASHSTYGLATLIGNAAGAQSAWIGWVATATVGVSNTIGGGFFGRNYGSGITGNDWHHVTLSFGGGSNGNAKLYVDGIEKVSDTYTPNLQSNSIVVGKANTGTSYWFNGQIDHIKIYNYARTPAQIAYDYNRGAPVAHWKFDECEGTVAHDASGNENHGTINIGASGTQTTAGTCSTSGAWANGASGKFEGSLGFDGTDDYVCSDANSDGICDNSDDLNVTGATTYAAWIKTSDSAGQIMGGSSIGSGDFKLTLGLGGGSNGWAPSAFCSSGGEAASSVTVNDGNWHHIVAVYIPSTSITIYQDGVQTAQDTSITNCSDTNNPFYIGSNGSNYFLSGQIDDVRIYNYALSPAQIQKVYNQGYGIRYGPETGSQ